MKIVQFQNGKWAIQRGWWIFKEYKSKYSDLWWGDDIWVQKRCLFDSKQEALDFTKNVKGLEKIIYSERVQANKF